MKVVRSDQHHQQHHQHHHHRQHQHYQQHHHQHDSFPRSLPKYDIHSDANPVKVSGRSCAKGQSRRRMIHHQAFASPLPSPSPSTLIIAISDKCTDWGNIAFISLLSKKKLRWHMYNWLYGLGWSWINVCTTSIKCHLTCRAECICKTKHLEFRFSQKLWNILMTTDKDVKTH